MRRRDARFARGQASDEDTDPGEGEEGAVNDLSLNPAPNSLLRSKNDSG